MWTWVLILILVCWLGGIVGKDETLRCRVESTPSCELNISINGKQEVSTCVCVGVTYTVDYEGGPEGKWDDGGNGGREWGRVVVGGVVRVVDGLGCGDQDLSPVVSERVVAVIPRGGE
jgi:hypothetical protein